VLRPYLSTIRDWTCDGEQKWGGKGIRRCCKKVGLRTSKREMVFSEGGPKKERKQVLTCRRTGSFIIGMPAPRNGTKGTGGRKENRRGGLLVWDSLRERTRKGKTSHQGRTGEIAHRLKQTKKGMKRLISVLLAIKSSGETRAKTATAYPSS